MAKKMKLDSLLTANKKNKGIEKMSEYSNQEQTEKTATKPRPSSKDLLANAPIKKAASSKQENTIDHSHFVETQARPVAPAPSVSAEEEVGKRGRKRQYYDPRLKALEMQKISARTKIRIQNLINAKFDGYTPDKMFDWLYEYYIEKELSKDDRDFLNHVEETAMEEYKEKPKYQKLFAELENDEKKN
ncbi:hypothetical protein [Enterococcus pallens]|uniref:Uncharacterized protein n=1 Tax=Enterococcus pallens ATCC BAA-351 TaxID=1158607 RepID=R2SC51_9ENTE|nr:hypothetical protein [Enterococcus pallens]EOH93105.1 hypothetical protein UAU_02747 [Enterococcus pallens ATCC BAA-351]EOU24891.1 hypothetical protein I588_00878 [Enterococcus pallens ATCC BAA-351]OJG76768.1 hypothetical protein RV10_GL003273 [Enterococcus pallens]